MSKITKYYSANGVLELFNTTDGRSLEWEAFKNSTLGKLHSTIPFQSLSSLYPVKKHNSGRPAHFTTAGGIGLMVLKHYYKVSDAKLIELLNGNWMLQLFCGIRLQPFEVIRDTGIVSRWRVFLGKHLEVSDFQCICAGYWEEQLEHKHLGLTDATCYESHIEYPTDVKLLWKSCCWLWEKIKLISKSIKSPLPRLKFKEQHQKYLSYQKRRRKTRKEERRRRRSLLYLLNKLRDEMSLILGKWRGCQRWDKARLNVHFFNRLGVIKKVHMQQRNHFDRPKDKTPNRIVSLAKPYIRPIIRGKETKRVEFGMKTNEWQVDGINFLEHGDFEAFHEGIRLIQGVWMHRRYFGRLSQAAADAIYATNKNRRYCTSNGISHNFKPKGNQGKHQEQKKSMQAVLGKLRATRMEGSFGNFKNHYLLDRIKARTFHSEWAWIFFGIFTANAVNISKRKKPPP